MEISRSDIEGLKQESAIYQQKLAILEKRKQELLACASATIDKNPLILIQGGSLNLIYQIK